MTTAPRDYLSVHIYYNTTDLRPVLLDCVDPLIRQLQEANMLSRYFFVRYWEGGCHVRLRLLPGDGVTYDDLRAKVEPAVKMFLDETPSLFDPDHETLRSLMRSLYEYEYGREEFIRRFGPDGNIEIADNNSFCYIPYKPEYGRYGGMHGIELSEQHFHISSTIALESLRESNSHIRSSTLGLALQLMFHFAVVFFESKERVVDFFREYSARWHELSVSEKFVQGLDHLYEAQETHILAHFSQVDRIHQNLGGTQNDVLSKWIRHAYWLRDNINQLYAAGKLGLTPPATSLDSAIRRLLTSYIHMMSNRLGVLILEEMYMAHLIVRALTRNV